MKLSQFKYRLPDERVAQYPCEFGPDEERPYFHRDDCRLMVVHAKSGVIEHRESFRDIINFFDEKDVFVFNDTKVFPARLYGNKEKTGAKIEVFLLRELNADMRLWDVLVDPARKIRIGNKLYFGEDNSMVAEVIDNTTSRGRTLRFLYDGPHDEFKHALYSLGEAPLPREIIKRPSEPEDMEDFQTVFAKNEGAVTAPTAGMHFSPQLLKMMEIKGIEQAFVTLHCGLGCFRSIDVEDLTKHKTDSEEMHVTQEPATSSTMPSKTAGASLPWEQRYRECWKLPSAPTTTSNPTPDGPTSSSSRHTTSALPMPWWPTSTPPSVPCSCSPPPMADTTW